jgi:hypothetical protein
LRRIADGSPSTPVAAFDPSAPALRSGSRFAMFVAKASADASKEET